MDDNDSDEDNDDELNESDSSHEEVIETLAGKRIWRQRITTADDFWKSPWGILLRNPKVADPTSLVGTKFGLRLVY